MHFAPAITLSDLLACCGSHEWAKRMDQGQPYASAEEMLEAADRTWWQLTPQDWLQAFGAHPRIGESSTDASARREQSGLAGAEAETLARLGAGNRAYEQRFGYIYIVCATGKSAAEMLAILESRLGSDPETELRVAAEQQRQIMRLRLERWMKAREVDERTMSAITTHVLDTSRGMPAAGIRVTLEVRFPDGAWQPLGKAVTDADGRAKDLLPEGVELTDAVYRLTFGNLPEGLYPEVTIAFRVRDASRHYHIPLLWSPYGYTTYRGS